MNKEVSKFSSIIDALFYVGNEGQWDNPIQNSKFRIQNWEKEGGKWRVFKELAVALGSKRFVVW